MNGKPGTVTERCCDFEPMNRIGWVMEKDSYGFARMLEDMGFDFRLESVGPQTIRIINTTYYRPRHLLASLISMLMLKRSFRKVRQAVLENLKRIAESAETQSATAGSA